MCVLAWAMGTRFEGPLSSVVLNECVLKENDLISLGSGAILDRCYVVGHAFEHYRLQIGPVRVGNKAVVRPSAQLLISGHVDDEGSRERWAECSTPAQRVV